MTCCTSGQTAALQFCFSLPAGPSPRLTLAAQPCCPCTGYCGLYAIDRFPEDAAAFANVDTARLLDIRQYCANAVANDVLVLVGLGTILRLLSALALAYIPRGLRLEPAVNVVARLLAARRRQRQSLVGAA